MENVIFMSIKEEHIERILKRTKNHEFRTKIPNKKVDYVFVYVPVPIKELKYILKVDLPIKTPNKIDPIGIGNEDFNNYKKEKYAYPIKSVYKINNSLSLEFLRKKFNFTAPQAFAYGEKYKELLNYVESIGITKLY